MLLLWGYIIIKKLLKASHPVDSSKFHVKIRYFYPNTKKSTLFYGPLRPGTASRSFAYKDGLILRYMVDPLPLRKQKTAAHGIHMRQPSFYSLQMKRRAAVFPQSDDGRHPPLKDSTPAYRLCLWERPSPRSKPPYICSVKMNEAST